MAFSTSTVLCNHCICLVPERFITPKGNLIRTRIYIPFFHTPSPSQPAVSLLSLWIRLFWTSRVNRIIQYVAFYDCLFEVHPSCTIYQFFIPFHGGIIFCCMHKPQILTPFNHWWTLGLSSPFHYCEQCCCEHCCLSICLNPCFQFFWVIYFGVELLGHMVILCLTFWGTAKLQARFCINTRSCFPFCFQSWKLYVRITILKKP